MLEFCSKYTENKKVKRETIINDILYIYGKEKGNGECLKDTTTRPKSWLQHNAINGSSTQWENPAPSSTLRSPSEVSNFGQTSEHGSKETQVRTKSNNYPKMLATVESKPKIHNLLTLFVML